jgi:DNA-binding NtrC family response regulator
MLPGCGSTLLAVDDEPVLLRLMEAYLSRLGYVVETCSSAHEALQRFRQRPTSYALVVTDMSMPDMAGEELLAKLTKLNPQVRVLACSGYLPDLETLPESRGRLRYLQKPFTPDMLASAVAEILSEPAA